MAEMSERDAALAAAGLHGDALENLRALVELMFRKGLITPAELDGVLAVQGRRRMAHERMWAGISRQALGVEEAGDE